MLFSFLIASLISASFGIKSAATCVSCCGIEFRVVMSKDGWRWKSFLKWLWNVEAFSSGVVQVDPSGFCNLIALLGEVLFRPFFSIVTASQQGLVEPLYVLLLFTLSASLCMWMSWAVLTALFTELRAVRSCVRASGLLSV